MTHWQQVSTTLEPEIITRFAPRLLMDSASDRKLIDRLDLFAEANIPPQARLDVRNAESNIRYLARIREERLPQVEHWLQQRAALTDTTARAQ